MATSSLPGEHASHQDAGSVAALSACFTCNACARLRCLPPPRGAGGDQEAERCRRHAVDAAGLADGARPSRLQLLPDFVGKPGQCGVIESRQELEALVAAIGRDIGGLALEIDGVFGVDLELLGDLGRWPPSSGQIRATSRHPMFG